jgi:hypothetical protein
MFLLRKCLVIKGMSFSPTMLLSFVLISCLLLFASITPMYPTYAQNIDPAQGAQPNSQGRPLSNYPPVSPSNTGGNSTVPLDLNTTGGNSTVPLDLNTTGGNSTVPLDLNTTGGNFSGAPNQLNNFTSPTGNMQEGAPGGNAAEGAPGGSEGRLGPNNQLLSNQTTPIMNNTIPPAKPVIFTKNLSNNSGTSSEQKVATSGSDVYVVWEDTSSGGNSDILLARSGNDGATFGNVTPNLSNNTGESTNPKIAAFRNNVYVVWEDTSSGGNSDILFTKSTDSGATFGNVTNLSNNTGESTNPQIFASGKNVYVAWEDTTLKKSDILLARSENNGATFGNVTANLSKQTGESTNPQIFASGKNVYVAWEDTSSGGNNSDILFTKSTDSGATFGNVTANLSDNTGQSTNPKIAAFRNNVYVVWEDYSLINSIKNQILFTRSTDNGMTFDNTIRLNNNTGQSTNPKISAFRNNVYVVWEDTSSGGNSNIAFTSSPNNGATFGNVINVNAITGQPLPGQPLNPQILASGSSVYIAWTNRNITTGNDIVLFAKSSNNGIAFSDIRSLSNPGGESVLPQVATSGNNVYVTWSYDDTAKATQNANTTLGSSDVIFLRGTSGNFPGSSVIGPLFAPGANVSGGAVAPPSAGGSEFAPGGSIQGGAVAPPSGGGLSNPGGGSEFAPGANVSGGAVAPPSGGGSEFAPGGSIQGGAVAPPSGGGLSNPGGGSEFAPGGSIQGGAVAPPSGGGS